MIKVLILFVVACTAVSATEWYIENYYSENTCDTPPYTIKGSLTGGCTTNGPCQATQYGNMTVGCNFNTTIPFPTDGRSYYGYLSFYGTSCNSQTPNYFEFIPVKTCIPINSEVRVMYSCTSSSMYTYYYGTPGCSGSPDSTKVTALGCTAQGPNSVQIYCQ